MEDIDIWRAAEQMRKLYGADAAIHSAMRADMCGKADPLHVAGSFDYMKTKVLLQEMQEYDGSSRGLARATSLKKT